MANKKIQSNLHWKINLQNNPKKKHILRNIFFQKQEYDVHRHCCCLRKKCKWKKKQQYIVIIIKIYTIFNFWQYQKQVGPTTGKTWLDKCHLPQWQQQHKKKTYIRICVQCGHTKQKQQQQRRRRNSSMTTKKQWKNQQMYK